MQFSLYFQIICVCACLRKQVVCAYVCARAYVRIRVLLLTRINLSCLG